MAGVSGVTLVTLAAYLVAMLLLGRTLSKEAFGQLNLSVYALNLLGMASLLGFPNALLRNVPRDRLERSDWKGLNRSLAGFNAGVCLLGVALYGLLYDTPLSNLVLLLVAALFLGQSLFLVTVLQIFRRFALAQGLFTLWRPVLLIAALLAYTGALRGLTPLLAAIAAGAAGQYALLVLVLRRAPRGPDPIPLRSLTHDAGVFFVLGLTAVLISRLDSFFLPRMIDFDTLGVYATISFYALTAYAVVSMGVGQVLNPLLASRERVPTTRIAVGLALGGLALAGVLAALADWAVPFAFGERYAGHHRPVAAALAVAGVFQVLYAVPSSRIGVLASRRVFRGFIAISLSSVVVDVALILFCLPRWGLTGAALATAGTWFWRTTGCWVVASRFTRSV